ncbi:hypothetical protein [Devosia sp. MC521]|uniref:hypothetical protein n=1 Tax=Devosia sp. MC521 TaxID=2759954 RepID=UPI0015F9EC27|nr:hypothetical protein [Devosia sp. MC521]MBJ6986069.1 hypothetical protein [Devosia sp. MC521]QMW61439.1 hypothetical protein H4N61_10635 [Devosia sp. MC521]
MKTIIDLYDPAVIAAYAERPHIIELALADLIIERIDPTWPNLETELESSVEQAVLEAYDPWDEDEEMPLLVKLYESGTVDVDRVVDLALDIISENKSAASH